MHLYRILRLACLSLFGSFVLLTAAQAQVSSDIDQAVRQALANLQPGLPIESVSPTPLKDLFQVQLEGGRVLYVTGDGQYVVQGYLYQLKGNEPVNLTEKAESRAVAQIINAVPADEMVVYPAEGETKTHITIFTDITCPYCQKLHAEIPELNRQGIEVRYMAFPRQGPASDGDQQLQAIWCSKDRRAAMDSMVKGKKVSADQCDSPVAKQYQLGHTVGVQGTPAVVLTDGKIIPGYQPAAQLAKQALAAQ